MRKYINFRGSGGLIMVNDSKTTPEDEYNYLMIIHEPLAKEYGGGRSYTHRFIGLNNAYNICGVSDMWYLDHRGVEFCRSMILDKGNIVMGFGLEDAEAYIVKIDLNEVKKLIHPIELLETLTV